MTIKILFALFIVPLVVGVGLLLAQTSKDINREQIPKSTNQGRWVEVRGLMYVNNDGEITIWRLKEVGP